MALPPDPLAIHKFYRFTPLGWGFTPSTSYKILTNLKLQARHPKQEEIKRALESIWYALHSHQTRTPCTANPPSQDQFIYIFQLGISSLICHPLLLSASNVWLVTRLVTDKMFWWQKNDNRHRLRIIATQRDHFTANQIQTTFALFRTHHAKISYIFTPYFKHLTFLHLHQDLNSV